MFTFKEAAVAHALAAEKLLEPDTIFINKEAMVPIFVNLLLQSLEITLKSFAIEAKLANEDELRYGKNLRHGHGIKEIAEFINTKIGNRSLVDILLPRQGYAISNSIIQTMIFDDCFAPTRESYINRNIAYSQFKKGELQIVQGLKSWVEAVKSAALNIESAVVEIQYG